MTAVKIYIYICQHAWYTKSTRCLSQDSGYGKLAQLVCVSHMQYMTNFTVAFLLPVSIYQTQKRQPLFIIDRQNEHFYDRKRRFGLTERQFCLKIAFGIAAYPV